MGIKQLYNDNLRKLPNEYGDVSVMFDKFGSGSICNLTAGCLMASGQKLFKINEIWVTGDLGQRSKNDLDLWYMYISMYSV